MYLSSKAAFVRNIAAAGVNGAITLILLLIAPLGLLAVIVNTLLVTLSTFLVCTAADRIVFWLLPSGKDRQHLDATRSPTVVLPVDKTKKINPGDRP